MVIAAVAIVAAINLAAIARRVPPPSRFHAAPPNETVTRQERRLALVQRAMAARNIRGPIGYLADLPAAEMPSDPGAMREFFVSQFVLAPIVLDTRADAQRWAVANLHTAELTTRLPAGFRIVEACGPGVWLLERNGP
jgi:hypothetical protein